MTDALQQALAEHDIRQQLADSTLGEVESIDWDAGLAVVSVGGQLRQLPWVGAAPEPQATVRISVLGRTRYCQAFESTPAGSPFGTVVSKAVDLLTVTGDDGVTYKYQYAYDVNFIAGDRVVLDHPRKVVLLRLSTTPPPEPSPSPPPAPKPPPPKPQPVRRVRDFVPAWSGTWRNGSPTYTDVNVGSTQLGAYGYGTSIRDTIPNGAAVENASLALAQTADRLPNIASLMGTHAYNGKPGGFTNAAVNGAWSVGGGSRELDIRGDIIGRLISGAAFGIAFRSGQSWRTYAAAPSGRIRVQWVQ